MGFIWNQGLLRISLQLPILWVLLSPVCCSDDLPTWHFTSSEVVIPKKVPHGISRSEMPDQLAYSMRFRGQRHVLHMKLKKNMMPRHFPVFTDNDQGVLEENYPFIPQDCYYYSYLEGVPGSLATLDTCYGGLRGMLQVDDYTYEIKPLKASPKFEHTVSLLVSEERTQKSEKCESEGNNQFLEEIKFESPRAAPVYLWRRHVKNARIHYTISQSLWRQNSNLTHVVDNIVVLNSVLNSIFRPTGVNVYVRAICIWEGGDQINLSGDTQSIAGKFGMFKTNFYWQIEHSSSLLLTGHRVGSLTHFSFSGGMCNPNWGVMYVFASRYHVFLIAGLSAHELGHSAGLKHDTEGCICFRRSSCVMIADPGLHDMLSNCSYSMMHSRLHNWDPCLSYPRDPYTNFPYITKRCGDKSVNENEGCDCGSLKECVNSKCCGTNCQLTIGSDCDNQICCTACKFSPAGTICRDKHSICDLPEYCNGQSPNCPDNFHIQDGTPCSTMSVCISGNCSDRNTQCQALFGYKVKDASEECYQQLNVLGDRFGNCGVVVQRGGSKPLKCETANILCGLLHCNGVIRIPGGGEHTTFRHLRIKGFKEENCYGYEAHHGAEVPEMGLVVDGATCGPGKYCRRQNCTFHQDIGYSCDIRNCSFRGVCNNRQHCHCLYGWKPPSCDQKGFGGSEDSGPPPAAKDYSLRAQIRVTLNRILLVLSIRLILILVALLLGAMVKIKLMIGQQ